MHRKRFVDWMLIQIEKIAETDDAAEYAFFSDVYEPDPKYRSRMMTVGQNRGVLRVAKVAGEVTLVEAMPEDEGDKCFERAAAKIRKHWAAREFPDKTMFRCG